MEPDIQKKLDSFFCRFKKQQYKKGEVLLRASENPQGVFYLKSGTVKQYAISQKGEELVVNIFKAPSFFPLSWALHNTPNQYFYEANSTVEVYRAPGEETIEFLKTNPDVLFDLVKRIYKGLDGFFERIVHLMTGNAYERLVSELILYAKRFNRQKENIAIGISENSLAAQTGMTRETISREMKTLKQKGLVKGSGAQLTIVNLPMLEKELVI